MKPFLQRLYVNRTEKDLFHRAKLSVATLRRLIYTYMQLSTVIFIEI